MAKIKKIRPKDGHVSVTWDELMKNCQVVKSPGAPAPNEAGFEATIILTEPHVTQPEFDPILVRLLNMSIPINKGSLATYVNGTVRYEPHMMWNQKRKALMWTEHLPTDTQLTSDASVFIKKVAGMYHYYNVFPYA